MQVAGAVAEPPRTGIMKSARQADTDIRAEHRYVLYEVVARVMNQEARRTPSHDFTSLRRRASVEVGARSRRLFMTASPDQLRVERDLLNHVGQAGQGEPAW